MTVNHAALHRHEEDVVRLQEEVFQKRHRDNRVQTEGISKSHTMRKAPTGISGLRLNLENFNKVLEIDVERKVAVVEPRVTMEALVAATLPFKLAPLVIAEFKNITAGGAVIGTSLESSSHQYGQFNDTCLAYTVLLGDGSVIRATAEENSDLFYALPGSFGALGVLLSIEIKLVPVTGWVKLCYSRFDSVEQAVDWMSELHSSEDSPYFLEGLAFSEKHIVVITGRHSLHDEVLDKGVKKISLGHYWAPWFYQIMRKNSEKMARGEVKEALISLPDYLFRYDRGAFWMGSYALHGALLARYIGANFCKIPQIMSKTPFAKYAQLRDPGIIFRGLWGWLCASKTLYRILHYGTEGWFAKASVIQDFYIPAEQTVQFVREGLAKSGISPFWLCPIKTVGREQFLAPHALKGDLAFDVGIYGFPNHCSPPALTREFEKLADSFGGRKMLYSYSFFTKEEFWKIYDKSVYDQMRQKYHAEGVWPDMIDKVLQKP